MRLNEKIKNALDPKGILAPGKNGIWPQVSASSPVGDVSLAMGRPGTDKDLQTYDAKAWAIPAPTL